MATLPESRRSAEQYASDLAGTTAVLSAAYELLFVTAVSTKMKDLDRQRANERSSLSHRTQLSGPYFLSNCSLTVVYFSGNVARREVSGGKMAHTDIVDCS